MLRIGDRVFVNEREIGTVVRLEGDEAWILNTVGNEERWNVRVDELPWFEGSIRVESGATLRHGDGVTDRAASLDREPDPRP